MYLSGKVGCTSLGHLEDNGRLRIASGFKGCYYSGRGGDVLHLISSDPRICWTIVTYNCGNCKVVLLRIVENWTDIGQQLHLRSGKIDEPSRLSTSSPTMTPALRLRISWTPIIATCRNGLNEECFATYKQSVELWNSCCWYRECVFFAADGVRGGYDDPNAGFSPNMQKRVGRGYGSYLRSTV